MVIKHTARVAVDIWLAFYRWRNLTSQDLNASTFRAFARAFIQNDDQDEGIRE